MSHVTLCGLLTVPPVRLVPTSLGSAACRTCSTCGWVHLCSLQSPVYPRVDTPLQPAEPCLPAGGYTSAACRALSTRGSASVLQRAGRSRRPGSPPATPACRPPRAEPPGSRRAGPHGTAVSRHRQVRYEMSTTAGPGRGGALTRQTHPMPESRPTVRHHPAPHVTPRPAPDDRQAQAQARHRLLRGASSARTGACSSRYSQTSTARASLWNRAGDERLSTAGWRERRPV
jgi:hypothetical protein